MSCVKLCRYTMQSPTAKYGKSCSVLDAIHRFLMSLTFPVDYVSSYHFIRLFFCQKYQNIIFRCLSVFISFNGLDTRNNIKNHLYFLTFPPFLHAFPAKLPQRTGQMHGVFQDYTGYTIQDIRTQDIRTFTLSEKLHVALPIIAAFLKRGKFNHLFATRMCFLSTKLY